MPRALPDGRRLYISVYDAKTEQLMTAGTAREVAKALCIEHHSIYSAIYHYRKRRAEGRPKRPAGYIYEVDYIDKNGDFIDMEEDDDI